MDYYNLDVVISVGYRVKSKEGTNFRQWVNRILKSYLLSDYAINQRRLEYLEKTIKLMDSANTKKHKKQIQFATLICVNSCELNDKLLRVVRRNK